jgi:hypothetical protein
MPPRRTTLLSCLCALALRSTLAFAQDDADGQQVHRCVGRHGEIVFSGLACNASESADYSAGATATTSAAPPADSCPASQQELRDRLAGAIARHDANTIAGMLRWRGVGAAAASERLRALRDLVKFPLLALDVAGSDGDAQAARGLWVRTGSNTQGGVREHAFGVDLEGGCYWLVW